MPLKVINPYDQKPLCELPWDNDERLEKKIIAAGEVYAGWHRMALEERAIQVRRGLERFRNASETVARDLSKQMGKPIRQARNEVKGFFERAEYMLSIAKEALSPDILPAKEGFHRRIEHAPLGLVLDIAAFNYPLLISVNVIVPALLAGNTVLLKQSPKTPLCGEQLAEAFGDLDPPHLVTHLILSNSQTSRLVQDPRINYIAFTGSVPVGKYLYRQASQRIVDMGLELGGKDPAYVAGDADLAFAAENVIDGACYNAGQSCCAVERVYVHHTLYDSFLERAKSLLEAYRMGDPLEESTTLGPLADRAALGRLEDQVKDAVKRGARLLLGGKRLKGSSGNFFPPTLLADVPNDAKVMQEESFGPIVPVKSVADDEEALACMNESRYGLSASIWTRSRERAERFARELEVGTVYQNRCDYLDPALPWSGARESGIGSTLSRYGFYHLTRRKAIHFRTNE
jgi:acyl-CoA reductase-like NAD-dependent aldehyde dehydrogenase